MGVRSAVLTNSAHLETRLPRNTGAQFRGKMGSASLPAQFTGEFTIRSEQSPRPKLLCIEQNVY
jgi:hypothetical protein